MGPGVRCAGRERAGAASSGVVLRVAGCIDYAELSLLREKPLMAIALAGIQASSKKAGVIFAPLLRTVPPSNKV